LDAEDRELVARVLAGDRERFHDLVERHSGALWTTLRQALDNPEDAREVFQETWLHAWAHLGTLRDPARLRPWLFSIAFNRVRAHHRRLVPQGLAGGDDAPAAPPFPAGSALELRERDAELWAEVERLPARQRGVLSLRLLGDLAHAEIGALLGISEEASRASYYQALRTLKRRLEPTQRDASHGPANP
jgi:RNA polymerase sigma-70 factor (ECF subfamily)